MKYIKYIVLIALLFLLSCRTQKQESKKTIVKDSIIYVDKVKIDTFKVKEIKTITKPIYSTIEIPCDSSEYTHGYTSGGNLVQVSKDKGKVKIITKTDSVDCGYKEKYFSTQEKLDSITNINFQKKTENETVIHETFWQSLMSNIWKLLFFIMLIFWLIGLSFPKIVKIIFKT